LSPALTKRSFDRALRAALAFRSIFTSALSMSLPEAATAASMNFWAAS